MWVALPFSFDFHLHGISFSKPSLSVFMCSQVWGGSLIDSIYSSVQFSSVTQLCPTKTPRTEAHQASPSFTNCQSFLKHMSIELVMPSNHLILCHSLLLLPSIFPSIRVFQFFISGGQRTGVSASALVLPMNIQDWFPFGLTDWISFQSKGLSRVFSSTAVQKHQFFSAQLSLQSNSHIHTRLLEKP